MAKWVMVAVAGLLTSASFGEAANFIAAASDAAGHSSLTNKLNWSDASSWTAGTAETGVWQPSSQNDYVISDGKVVRQPRFTPYVFKGNSLTFGTDTSSGSFGAGNPAQTVEMTAENDGLVFVKGSFGQFYESQTKVHGKVTIKGTGSRDGTLAFRLGANQKMHSLIADGASLHFLDAVSGAEGTYLQCDIAGSTASNTGASNSVYRFTGDLSKLYTTIRLRPWSDRGRYDSAFIDTAQIPNRFGRVTFSTSSSTMPGKIDAWCGGAIQLYTPETQFSVGSVEFSGENRLEVRCDFDTGDVGCMKVTGEYVQSGKVSVLVGSKGMVKPFAKKPILKVPSGAKLDIDAFALENIDLPFHLSVSDDPADSLSTLWLSMGKIVTLKQADAANARESFRKQSSATIAHSWDDGNWPSAGNEYVVEGMLIRSPNQAKDEQTGNVSTGDFGFLGGSLTLMNGATFAIRSASSITNNDLRIFANGKSNVTISHYATANKNVWPYGKSGLCTVAGHARVGSVGDAKVLFSLSSDRAMRYDMDLKGEANMAYQAYCEASNANPPNGHHWVAASNPNLKGLVQIRYNADYTWTAGGGVAVPSMDYCCRVYIGEADSLGGKLDKFDVAGINIEDYSVIHPMKTMTFDDPNRGIRIHNWITGGAAVGRFDITNDVTLTLKQRINFRGTPATLVKEGVGTLELGAGCLPTFGGEQADAPTSDGVGTFRITAGALKLTGANACRGLDVSFGKDTKLVLEADATDATLVATGLEPRSLTLEGDAAGYAVEIVKGAGDKPANKRVGLITVDESAASAVRGKITAANPYPGCSMSIVETKKDGKVTFSAEFKRGFFLLFR